MRDQVVTPETRQKLLEALHVLVSDGELGSRIDKLINFRALKESDFPEELRDRFGKIWSTLNHRWKKISATGRPPLEYSEAARGILDLFVEVSCEPN